MAGLATVSSVFLRLALGISFLSAVADRFGIWGVYGQPNVAWGNYARFVAYTAKLNWFLPASIIPSLAIISTVAEVLFGFILVLGWKTRITTLLSGILLASFALTMTIALGVKAPLLSASAVTNVLLVFLGCTHRSSVCSGFRGLAQTPISRPVFQGPALQLNSAKPEVSFYLLARCQQLS
jgi:hypothetical protein